MGLGFGVQTVKLTGIHFSYNQFNVFRHRIARSIGLDVYHGTGEDMYKTGRWKEIEHSHPVYPLINHDDCEGELGPDDCGMVGAYLKTLIQEWKKERDVEGINPALDYDITEGERLADLMVKCHEDGDTLVFL